MRAISDGSSFLSLTGDLSAVSIARGAQTGATVIRLPLYWNGVEKYASAPADPTDPADPGYHFDYYDAMVRNAARAGLTPLFTVLGAPPRWEGPHRWRYAPAGTWAPDPAALGHFAIAAARRYSGHFPDPLNPGRALPRVAMWQAWNEPNLPKYLSPQWVGRGGRWLAWAPRHYRRMLNAFYAGVKSIDRTDTVVTAGTAPDGDTRDGVGRMTPLRFWQSLLCLGAPPRLSLAPCGDAARFDVLAYHPLSIGDPDRAAGGLGVSIADLGKLRHLLDAARRTGRARLGGRERIWVTELNWDSGPGKPGSATPAQLRRWIPRALYLLWHQGVDLVTWELLRDPPAHPRRPAGLFSIDPADPLNPSRDRPKPALNAFRFPVTAIRRAHGRVEVWGLLPSAGPRVATLQRRVGGRWRAAGRLAVSSSGLIDSRVPLRGRPSLRLIAGARRSMTFVMAD
jgi:hypothetical protein